MSGEQITVLVTGTGGGVGQGILKALRMSDLDLRVVSADVSPFAPGLYTGDSARLTPMVSEPGYVEAMCRICRGTRKLLPSNNLWHPTPLLRQNPTLVSKESAR